MGRKRKYTRSGDVAQGYECTKTKCKWQGIEDDKARRAYTSGGHELICPNCGNPEFYGLLEY
tara:strand:+ start:599 stop:784 length:186 start_codon:yes stop_codon:yes gene_type:complete